MIADNNKKVRLKMNVRFTRTFNVLRSKYYCGRIASSVSAILFIFFVGLFSGTPLLKFLGSFWATILTVMLIHLLIVGAFRKQGNG